MSLLVMILLAIVQGITEFLPVSSDGHLVMANALVEACGGQPVEEFVEVEMVLHLGTLLAVLVYYRREIVQLFTSHRRVIPLLIVGTIPAAVIGLYIKKGLPDETGDAVLESPLIAGFGFLITAGLLLWAIRRPVGDKDYPQLTWTEAFKIGCLQAFALLPGVSRSGSTIAAGLGVGLQRKAAATFSFLLAIPAIAGAASLVLLDALTAGGTDVPLGTLAIGFVVSFVVGLGALALLIRWVQQGRLALFAYYLIPLGIAVVAWQTVL